MTDYYLEEIFDILQQTFIDDDEKCAELATLEWMCRNVLEWGAYEMYAKDYEG